MWGRRADSDFQAEIEAHVRLEADRQIADGRSPAEAHAAARRALGNVGQVQERFYESRRWQWWEQLRQDLRYAARSLYKTPAFTAAAALTIALGVGANTAVFSLVDAVLLQSLPVLQPRQLFFLQMAGTEGLSGAPAYACFTRLRKETRSFEDLLAFAADEMRVEVDGRSEQVMGQVTSENYFDLLGVQPSLGRLMRAGDGKLNPPIAVISDRYWRRRFGGDPAVIGKTIYFQQRPYAIAGVTPAGFWGLTPGASIDLTLPIFIDGKGLMDPGDLWLHAVVGRVKSGVSSSQAQAEANVAFQSFMADHPIFPPDQVRKRYQRMELNPASHGMDVLRRRFSQPLYVLMGIVSLVLLLAAANIANLLLARGIARQREFAIRLATGAGRLRLVRQLLTETLFLFALGAIPGVFLASWGVGAIEGLFAQGRRVILVQAGLNWRVLAFTLMVTLMAGVLSGLFPAWRAFRTDPGAAIKTRTGESFASLGLTRALVAFQVALSLVLLVGAVTCVRTLGNLRDVDRGFRHDDVLTMSIEVPDTYLKNDESGLVWARVLAEVETIPGVRSAAVSSFTPLSGRDRRAVVRVRGYMPATADDSVIHVNQVSEGYFPTFGILPAGGRLLNRRDTLGAPPVIVINEAAAGKFFGGRDPVGESVDFQRSGVSQTYRVAGVVRDTKHNSLREPTPPFAFIPIRQPRDPERRITLSVGSSAPAAVLAAIRSKVAGIDSAAMISEVITIRTQLDSTLLTERLLSGLSSAFGFLALILAAVGLYGVLSYRVGQQRQSIGVRMALGASPASVRRDVLRQSGLVIAAGLVCGLPFAVMAARAADSIMWGVQSNDPTIYAIGVVLLSVAGLASAWLPAHRASAIQPSEALRHS